MPAFKTKYPGIYWRVAKDGTKRWDVYVGGVCKTFKREGDALKDQHQRKLRTDQGDQPTSDRRTFAQYLTDWLELKAKGAVRDRNGKKKPVGPRTMFDYQTMARDWIIAPTKTVPSWIGKTRIDRVTDRTLESLYTAMEQQTTVGTIAKLNRFLGQVFASAVKKGILARNPAEFADLSSREEKRVAKAMTEEQVAEFLKSARAIADEQQPEAEAVALIPERCWSALWHVLGRCGLRPGEALALRWQDVDEIGRQMHIEQNLIRVPGIKGYQFLKPKTRRAIRWVPIFSDVWAELEQWRKDQKKYRAQRKLAGEEWQDLGLVFTNSKGGPLHDIRRSFERVCARAGLGEPGPEPKREHATGPLPVREFFPAFRVYDLRHTSASVWILTGVPLPVVSEWLGHKKASFTLTTYVHTMPRQRKDAIAVVEDAIRKTG